MALQGTLSYLDISHLLQVVGTSRKSGVLEISFQDREARLFFQRGRLIRAESNRFHEGIGALLVEAGVLELEQLERALASQRSEVGVRRLGALLCDDHGVRPGDIERALRRQFERIVYDVFSWPRGTFVFHFQEQGEVLDRFHLNPVEFILGVGIQAGLLAREGVEREQRDPSRQPLVLLLRDKAIEHRCLDHWRRRGHQVQRCDGVEEVLGCVEAFGAEQETPVVVVDLVRPVSDDRGVLGGVEVLNAVGTLEAEIPVVVLGESSDPKARLAACSRGAAAYLKKPAPDDLAGPQGEIHLDVFMMTLEKAIQMAQRGDGFEEAGAPT